MVYTIGLGQIDEDFLKRISNDPDASGSITDGSQTEGLYVASPSPAQIRQGFQIVANQIFRLIN